MSTFVSFLQGLVRPIKPWVTVKPWEQGLRVRFGKHVRLLPAGMFWKLPLSFPSPGTSEEVEHE